MSFYSGSDGQLLYAESYNGISSSGVMQDGDDNSVEKVIAKVRNWSFTSTTASLDTTTLGDTDRTMRHGIRSASGNADLLYYTGASSSMASARTLIGRQLGEAEDDDDLGVSDDEPGQFFIKFLIGRGTSNPYYLISKCLITSMTVNMAVGEVASVSIAFDLNGAPVKYRL
jgi:hypothetical protein